MKGKGELDVVGVFWGFFCLLGYSLAQLGTLWIGHVAGCPSSQAGQQCAAGTHPITPQIQWQLSISRQCAEGKRAGFSFELQPLSLGVPNLGDPSLL